MRRVGGLGIAYSPIHATVQGRGNAFRMTFREFRAAPAARPALRRIMNGYLYVQLEQVARSGTCASFHPARQRLARWLLMSDDLSDGTSFQSTQARLGLMLEVPRSGVSVAAAGLRDDGLIRYSRGSVAVPDRKGLESASCFCYREGLAGYDRTFP